MTKTMRGWIMALESDRAELEAMGIVLGPRGGEDDDAYFDACEVDEAAMDKLDPHWGRFFWALSSGEGVADGPAFTRETFTLFKDQA